MKIISDFITNSSSSSYVIMYKKIPEIRQEILDEYPFLKTFMVIIEKYVFDNDDEYTSTFSTLEEYNIYFMENYSYYGETIEEILEYLGDDDIIVKMHNKYSKKLKEGYSMVIRDIDDHDTTMIDIIEKMHDGENFIVEGKW